MNTIPDDVRRIWDSERISDDFDDCSDFDQTMRLLDQVDALTLPDQDEDADDDYRTDTWGEDYRIEEALENCPFDFDELSDNMIDSGPQIGFENISDLY